MAVPGGWRWSAAVGRRDMRGGRYPDGQHRSSASSTNPWADEPLPAEVRNSLDRHHPRLEVCSHRGSADPTKPCVLTLRSCGGDTIVTTCRNPTTTLDPTDAIREGLVEW